jgi:hypothetical protein
MGPGIKFSNNAKEEYAKSVFFHFILVLGVLPMSIWTHVLVFVMLENVESVGGPLRPKNTVLYFVSAPKWPKKEPGSITSRAASEWCQVFLMSHGEPGCSWSSPIACRCCHPEWIICLGARCLAAAACKHGEGQLLQCFQ